MALDYVDSGSLDDLSDIESILNDDNEEEVVTESKFKRLFKLLAIPIATVVLALIIILVVTAIKSNSKEQHKDINTVDKDNASVVNVDNTEELKGASNNNSSTNTDWIWLKDSPEIAFDEYYIDSVFHITDVKTGIKLLNESKDLIIKSVLVGTIDGFDGEFSIDVPYNKNYRQSIGKSFNIKVRVGEYSGRVVIGDIEY